MLIWGLSSGRMKQQHTKKYKEKKKKTRNKKVVGTLTQKYKWKWEAYEKNERKELRETIAEHIRDKVVSNRWPKRRESRRRDDRRRQPVPDADKLFIVLRSLFTVCSCVGGTWCWQWLDYLSTFSVRICPSFSKDGVTLWWIISSIKRANL